MKSANQFCGGSIWEELKLTARDRQILVLIFGTLRLLYRERPCLIKRALDVFQKNYWEKPKFPVFRGFKHWRAARFYVNFLLALKIPEERICIVLHSTDKKVIRRWRSILCHRRDRSLEEHRFVFVYRRPTNPRSKRAQTYVGIEPLFLQRSARGEPALTAARGFSVAMAFAAKELYRINTRPLQKKSSGLEAEPPANSEGKDIDLADGNAE